MTEKRDDGGLAFPVIATDGYVYDVGMSLRDYFAAQALHGWIADGAIARIIESHQTSISGAHIVLAEGCYQLADAMLRARAKA